MPSARHVWRLVPGALGLLLVAHVLLFFPMRVDDSFILLRYAENLAAGLGPVFNAGERVEGFTSPAMVVLEAALMRLGAEPLLAVKCLGLGWGLVLLASTGVLTRELSGSRVAAALAGLLVALHTGVAVACVNGLETAPFAALVALGLALHVRARSARDETLAGVALALALLFRLEGALPLAFVGASSLWRWRGEPDRWRRWLALALPTLVLAVPLYALKAVWFGALTPNTLLAKVPRDATGRLASGLGYLSEYGSAHLGYAALVSVWLLALRFERRFLLLAVLGSVWAGYVASVGGDWIPHMRFLVPLVPLASAALATAFVLLWRGLGGLLEGGLRSVSLGGLALVAGVGVLSSTFWQGEQVLERIQWDTLASLQAREPLGAWLEAQGGPGSSVALLDVGAVAYGSRLRVLDTGGLTDVRIARLIHESQGRYKAHLFFPDAEGARRIAGRVLADAPSFVVVLLNGEMSWLQAGRYVVGGNPLPILSSYTQDGALLEAPDFGSRYEYLCAIPSQPGPGWIWHYNVFVRRGLPLARRPAPDAEGLTFCFP